MALTLSMHMVILILKIVMIAGVKKPAGPHLEPEDKTSCEEFSRYARFNPYTVLDETWMVFYFWAPQTPTLRVDFTLPRKSDYKLLHDYLDEHVSTPVNWTARHVLIRESGQMSLLVENGDRGQYLMYVPLQGVPEGKKLDPVDVRFKQTGDNEVLGMMLCESQEVYAMARISKVPRKAHLQDAAARLNYRCRGGKSYLYAGHNWMPIPEQDERTFWSPLRQTRYMVD
ncbi:uncharacterized protein [Choristoneura fumiferana]|uniref:uncharacterized protein n=1 Tax=Choristoneura fumiferana TaxID=7141 RepID=UPI003D15A7F6